MRESEKESKSIVPDFTFSYLEKMRKVQQERSAQVGGHTWRTYVERYGPAILFADIASIVSRLEKMVWHGETIAGMDHERLQDLLVDLGNYSAFLYEWSIGKES